MVTKVVVEVAPTKKSRSRNWTDMEVNLFASVLVDEKYKFAASLENLSVQKSSNKEAFCHIKEIFDRAIKEADFKGNIMVKYFPKENGVSNFEPLDTSADKLRKKYNNLKAEWRKRTEQAKRMGGIYLDREPRWFVLLNAVFTAASEITNVVYHPVSLVYNTDQKDYYTFDEKHSIEEREYYTLENRHPTMIDDKEFYSIESNHVKLLPQPEATPVQMIDDHNVIETYENHIVETVPMKKTTNEKLKKKRRTSYQSCHRNRKLSTRQLDSLASSVQELASSLIEIKKISVENELRRDQMFFNFFTEEAEKNRAHELRLAEMHKGCPYGKPVSSSLPVTSSINSYTKPSRRSMLINHSRSSECMIPTRIVTKGEAVASSSSSNTPRIDAFFSLSPDENM